MTESIDKKSQGKDGGAIVVGKSSKTPIKHTKTFVIIGLIVSAIALALVFSPWNLIGGNKDLKPADATNLKKSEMPDEPEVVLDKLNKAELEEAQSQLEKAKTPEEKGRAYILLANSSVGSDRAKALEYAVEATKVWPTVEAYEAAISFAQLADNQTTLVDLESKLQQLGGAPVR